LNNLLRLEAVNTGFLFLVPNTIWYIIWVYVLICLLPGSVQPLRGWRFNGFSHPHLVRWGYSWGHPFGVWVFGLFFKVSSCSPPLQEGVGGGRKTRLIVESLKRLISAFSSLHHTTPVSPPCLRRGGFLPRFQPKFTFHLSPLNNHSSILRTIASGTFTFTACLMECTSTTRYDSPRCSTTLPLSPAMGPSSIFTGVPTGTRD